MCASFEAEIAESNQKTRKSKFGPSVGLSQPRLVEPVNRQPCYSTAGKFEHLTPEGEDEGGGLCLQVGKL